MTSRAILLTIAGLSAGITAATGDTRPSQVLSGMTDGFKIRCEIEAGELLSCIIANQSALPASAVEVAYLSQNGATGQTKATYRTTYPYGGIRPGESLAFTFFAGSGSDLIVSVNARAIH